MELDADAFDMWSEWAQYAHRTQEEQQAVAQLWIDGINLLIHTVTPLREVPWPERESGAVITAFMLHAATTQLAAYQLAVTGHVPQALLVARIVFEDLIAMQYICCFPERAPRFLEQQEKRAPTTNDMLQSLNDFLGDEIKARMQRWLNRLHKLSHVDPVSVLLTFGETSPNGQQWMHLGPHYDPDEFRQCVGEFVALIPPIVEAVQHIGKVWGVLPAAPEAPSHYRDRIAPFLVDTGTMASEENPAVAASPDKADGPTRT